MCHQGRGWKSTYLTEDKLEAERKCTADGGTFEWLPDNCLKTISPILSAVKPDPRSGKMTWFNSIVAVYHGWRDSRNSPEKAITYGDDSPLDAEDVQTCSRRLFRFLFITLTLFFHYYFIIHTHTLHIVHLYNII